MDNNFEQFFNEMIDEMTSCIYEKDKTVTYGDNDAYLGCKSYEEYMKEWN